MVSILEKINGFLWGVPTLILILSVGIYFTIRLNFLQIRLLPKAFLEFLRQVFRSGNNVNGTSSYRALCTALAATVGTGNMIGVAGAICLGGPGAIFWMWICGILGMVIKYAEVVLAIHFRRDDPVDGWIGGPMHIMKNGLPDRLQWMGKLYCFFGLIAAFGVGNTTQVNAVLGGVNSILSGFHIGKSLWFDLLICAILAVAIGVVLFGGASKIGKTAEILVPFAAVVYILLCIGVLVLRSDRILTALRSIVTGAFCPEAVTGGMLGSAFVALRVGAARGIFTNEAGMGTACIAHAGAQVDHPCKQGLMGLMEVFLDTLLICTLTALVILCSGFSIDYGIDQGTVVATESFVTVYGEWVSIPLTLCLCCFACATVLGWGLYGRRFASFLFGKDSEKVIVVLQILSIIVCPFFGTGVIWTMAETINALMVIPNLISVLHLSPMVIELSNKFSQSVALQKNMRYN